MMKKVSAVVLSFALATDASTRIAVLEFGKQTTVRRTTSTNAETSIQGIKSFWSALHASRDGQRSRKLQIAGMPVVPDLFNQPYSGVVIGLSGSDIDLKGLPTVSKLITEEDERVVGVMDVEGVKCSDILKNMNDIETVTSLKEAVPKHAEKAGLSGLMTFVDSSNAALLDEELGGVLASLEHDAEETGRTIVVHVVLDEAEEIFRRRVLLSRRLDNNVDDDANNNGQQQYSGYYGYGYYNAFDEWVTPYKTMFQIQYFNVVLWTAVGLFIGLVFCVYLMMFMPLEPDSLLFGESAKLMGEE